MSRSPFRERSFLLLMFTFVLSACEFSLAQDITPPPGSDLILQVATAEPIIFPDSPSDIQLGQLIYLESCAPCHGLAGLGDGSQARELPLAVPPIGDSELSRQKSPENWYLAISQGDIGRLMPPFADSLSPEERWDVLAHVYTLSLNPELVANAVEQYGQLCADCHGMAGKGDGPRASELNSELLNYADLTAMAGQTQQEFFDAIQQGIGEEMPGFPALEDDQVWALAAYVQNFAFGFEFGTDLIATQPEPTPEDLAIPETLDLSGHVVNESGGEIPLGAEITLHGYDMFDETLTQAALVEEGGIFRFEAVPLEAQRVFFASMNYAGLTYFSDFISSQDVAQNMDISFSIYETTSDISQLLVESVLFIVEFLDEDNVRLAQQVLVSNVGDRALIPVEPGQALLSYSLPPNASNLVFEQGEVGERYIISENGFGDMRSILPGLNSYRLIFAFDLPYQRALSFERSIDLITEDVFVLLPEGDVNLDGDQFKLTGRREIEGVTYLTYQTEGNLQKGDSISFELRGPHPLGEAGFSALVRDPEFLFAISALSATLFLSWLWIRRKPQLRRVVQSPEQLMDAIIALDDDYAQGALSDRRYQKKREMLKQRLRRSLREGEKV